MNAPLRDILLKLCRREDLTRDEAESAFLHLLSGEATDSQIGGLLIGLAAKGTTVDELVGAVKVMRRKSVTVPVSGSAYMSPSESSEIILDTCGTGGDVRGTFNVSTAAAIIAAAAGVRVVKHGNRSATSKSGSADVLEKLGVNLDLKPDQLIQCLAKCNLCFAFARNHNPAMKHVALARASLGIPTIFNVMGPLTNPAGAKHQLLGVFAPELTDKLAAVLRELGSERAWVVHAEDGLDEISTMGPTRITELHHGQLHTWTLSPTDLGLPYSRLSDLTVNSVEEAADRMHEILNDRNAPCRDIAALNAAAAMVIAGRTESIAEGLQLAMEAISSGRARRTLEQLVLASQNV